MGVGTTERVVDALPERLIRAGIDRRTFLKYCGTLAAVLALPDTYARNIAQALQSVKKPSVVWLQFQDCAGNTESFLRTRNPGVADLVLDILSGDDHETSMAAAGHQAARALISHQYPIFII